MNAHQKIIKDNAKSILKIITNYYDVKYSATLYQILKEHPDFPSFLSLQYILRRMSKNYQAGELQKLLKSMISDSIDLQMLHVTPKMLHFSLKMLRFPRTVLL